VVWKALSERSSLVARLNPRNLKCVRDAEPSEIKRFLRLVNQLQQAQPGIDVFG
jgi:hypothetical protein